MSVWSLAQRAGRYAVALGRYAANRFQNSSPETILRRLEICQRCNHFAGGACTLCECQCNDKSSALINKLAMASESCPAGKWGQGEAAPAPKLTVGMAMWNDFDGVYFTVRSLSLHHRELLGEMEILVVDSNPQFPDRRVEPHGPRTPSERIRDLCQNTPNARYVVHDGPGGTSQPRNQVFRDAWGDVVICIDSHVMLPPGALRRTALWFERNPDFHGLVHGPMLYDSNQPVTHMDRVWDDQMLGKWAYNPAHGGPASDPYEIDMHGLGLFGCRRADWLGFNAEFREFGGEEGYIQDKFRAAGRRVLLLPWLEWSHRFADDHAPPSYNRSIRARIRNYVIGRLELDLPVDDIFQHFFASEPRPGLRYRVEDWGEILEEVAQLMDAKDEGGRMKAEG